MTRHCLPNRRLAETFELEVAGLRYTCTVGRFDDGRLAEVFLNNHNCNSAAGGKVVDCIRIRRPSSRPTAAAAPPPPPPSKPGGEMNDEIPW